MLGKTGSFDLKKTDGPTGYWGMRTRDATRSFQKTHGLKVDGQINPGGETIRTLAKVARNALKNLVNETKLNPVTNTTPAAKSQARGDAIERADNQLSVEAFQANRRAAEYFKRRTGVGDYPRFTADAINTYGDKGVIEVGDLIRQVSGNNPDQANELLKRTVQGISPEYAERLNLAASGDHTNDPPAIQSDGAPFLERLGERIEEARRDIKEGVLRAGADAGDIVGLERSSRYLKHFLDGSGEDIVVPRDEARADPFIRESEAANRKAFEEKTFLGRTQKKKELNDELRSMKDGQTIVIEDDWQRAFPSTLDKEKKPGRQRINRLVAEPDHFLSAGSLTLDSKMRATAVRRGQTIHIEGFVDHNADDDYDFADGEESYGAYELQQFGRGRPFTVRQNWRQNVKGTVRILGRDDGGKMILGAPNFTWEDENSSAE